MAKINIAVTAPSPGLGGGNRKYAIYYKYLPEKYFNKHYIYVDQSAGKDKFFSKATDGSLVMGIARLQRFIKEQKIDFVYVDYTKKKIVEAVHDLAYLLYNVNFTQVYSNDPRVVNLVISKTDYWKLKWIHGKLSNSYVVYNPLDIDKWTKLSGEKGDYRGHFKSKKLIVGRLGRAEPSKWHYLVIRTMVELDRRRNYDYGFIFAGMPLMHRKYLDLRLSKKMRDCIIYLPELSSDDDLAKFYRSLDLFWQVAWIGESFGNVMAEAFCFKTPSIVQPKNFYKDRKMRRKLYDAQCEVVEHAKNGFYAQYPDAVVKVLESAKKPRLREMGLDGLLKCKKNYDARIAGVTLASVLQEFLVKKGIWKKNQLGTIPRIPSDKEVEDYEKEYFRRVHTAVSFNKTSAFKKFSFYVCERSWRLFEYIYLVIRKGLFIAGFDIERQK